ncbi:hypothetical protein HN51_067009 [Arachis hypogaea]
MNPGEKEEVRSRTVLLCHRGCRRLGSRPSPSHPIPVAIREPITLAADESSKHNAILENFESTIIQIVYLLLESGVDINLRNYHGQIINSAENDIVIDYWYGSWGVCFTYATWFGINELIASGKSYSDSPAIHKACEFLLSKQVSNGGWREGYLFCQNKVYSNLENNMAHLVNTSWALLALIVAGQYSVTRDNYSAIANGTFSNLVIAEWLQNTNSYSQDAIPAGGKPEDSLQSIANQTKLDPELLMKYNPGVNFR